MPKILIKMAVDVDEAYNHLLKTGMVFTIRPI